MRKLLLGLVAVMAVGSASPKTYTGKNFLKRRSVNDDMAMEYTGWHKLFRDVPEKSWGINLQATGFFKGSTNDTALGRYFGQRNEYTSIPGTTGGSNEYQSRIMDMIWIKARPEHISFFSADLILESDERHFMLDPAMMIHNPRQQFLGDLNNDGTVDTYLAFNRGITEQIDAELKLRPKVTSYGVVLDYHQKIDKLAKGLFFKVSVPVVCAKHDLNLDYKGDRLSQAVPYATNSDTNKGKTFHIKDYFKGCFTITGTQSALTHAKIDGARSKTGVADVDLTLGYNFLYKKHKNCNVSVNLTIPTTDSPDGRYLFEPTLGNAGHWSAGVGLDGAFEIWESGNKSLEFVGSAKYKYLFDATEKRTLGLKYSNKYSNPLVAGKEAPMAKYYLAGELNKQGLFPLANVLTRRVGVTPGSQIELLGNFVFNWDKFSFDLGYNLFAKEGESVTLKEKWPSATYAIADPDYHINATADIQGLVAGAGSLKFVADNSGNGKTPRFGYHVPLHTDPTPTDRPTAYATTGNATTFKNTNKNIVSDMMNMKAKFLDTGLKRWERRWIEEEDLLTSSCTTPVYVTHKVLFGASYLFDEWKNPILFGLGGSWEFTQGTNSAIDGYTFWAKIGVQF